MKRKIVAVILWAGISGWFTFAADGDGFPLKNTLSAKDKKVALTASLIWLRLEKTQMRCGDFDYFPEGGIRSFYCHIADIISYPELEKMMGLKIFLKGPHKNGELNFYDPYSFGHYNPEFVRSLIRIAVPITDNPYWKKEFQKVYNAVILPLARIAYITYAKLNTNPELKNHLLDNYKEYLKGEGEAGYPYYQLYSFMRSKEYPETPPPNISTFELVQGADDGGYNGNVVNSTVFFWMRRSLDETDKLFFQGLKNLLSVYDADFYARYKID